MQNIKCRVVNGHLVIVVDLGQSAGITTKSGNTMVATTNNWAKLEELPGYNFNMVLTRKAKEGN